MFHSWKIKKEALLEIIDACTVDYWQCITRSNFFFDKTFTHLQDMKEERNFCGQTSKSVQESLMRMPVLCLWARHLVSDFCNLLFLFPLVKHLPQLIEKRLNLKSLVCAISCWNANFHQLKHFQINWINVKFEEVDLHQASIIKRKRIARFPNWLERHLCIYM